MDDSRKPSQAVWRLLNIRRQQLRMSYAALSKRSGVSMRTVMRTLTGHNPNVSLRATAAIATGLGMHLHLQSELAIADLLERQAEKKARRLAGVVQGTSALEAQALDDGELRDLTRQTVHKLLAGSPRKLWDD